jgi:putative acyl-CoA dehydrogenase
MSNSTVRVDPTHEVQNQPPVLTDYDVYGTDRALVEGVEREGGAAWRGALEEIGRVAGSAAHIRNGFLANENPPKLRTHDRFGHRVDEVEFHPAWHELMAGAVKHGLHALPWQEPTPGAHVARAAKYYMYAQVEQGHGCPITMTYAVVPALRRQPDVARVWEPRILSSSYDPSVRPSGEKTGALFGMAMTEKQGGSDVRANTTQAAVLSHSGPGQLYALTGHKWFCSAPMCDGFLMLAQAPGGLSCFLVPRWREDGTRNAIHLQRLKDKLGNKSNASSEIELVGAHGRLIGEEGRGVPTIIEMVNHTRFDCVMGSAGLIRQAVVQAAHHTSHRKAFGRRLVDQPAMQNVLADLMVESEAATTLWMRLARSLDHRQDRDFEAPFSRIAIAVSKYYVCKRTPVAVYEALECLGGNGYVEEAGVARLYREAPLNSIWEGSGNVNALDVFRAMGKDPATFDALLLEIRRAKGADRRLDNFTDRAAAAVRADPGNESQARRYVEDLALALQGSLLVRHAPKSVADAFCASRLAGDWGRCMGTLPASTDFAAIITRGWSAAAPARN